MTYTILPTSPYTGWLTTGIVGEVILSNKYKMNVNSISIFYIRIKTGQNFSSFPRLIIKVKYLLNYFILSRLLLYIARPLAAMLPIPSDKLRAAAWLQALCTIVPTACSSMKMLRNDYMTALLGWNINILFLKFNTVIFQDVMLIVKLGHIYRKQQLSI